MSGPDTKLWRIKRLIVHGPYARLVRWIAQSGDPPTTSRASSPRVGMLRQLWDWLGHGLRAAPACREVEGSPPEGPLALEPLRVRVQDPCGRVVLAKSGCLPLKPSDSILPISVNEPGFPEAAVSGVECSGSSEAGIDSVAASANSAAAACETLPQAPGLPLGIPATTGPSTGVAVDALPDEGPPPAPQRAAALALPQPLGDARASDLHTKAADAAHVALARSASPPPPLAVSHQELSAGAAEATTARRPGWVIPAEPRPLPPPPVEHRVVVIGDCENDSTSVEAALRFAGALDKQGQLKARIRGAQIVQTGDLLYKNGPALGIVHFWVGLRSAATAAGCGLHLVAGNHELEIWRRLAAGERLGLDREGQRAVQGFIRSLVLFHVEGSMLLLHGYPTLNLLRHLLAFHRDTGRDLNHYNGDRFQRALADPRQLARYAYLRGDLCRDALLHDVADPERYYRRHGPEVARLLGALGIDLVVHGHRPERSGLQTDYEFRKWLPGIRMINNDIQLRLQGVGATLIRQVDRGPREVRFVNRSTLTLAHRNDTRRLLRVADAPAPTLEQLDRPVRRDPIPGFIPMREFGGRGFRGETRAAGG